MTAFFLRIVNISISASILAAVILLLRPLLKKAPRWVYVLLWGVVALRLIAVFHRKPHQSDAAHRLDYDRVEPCPCH